VAQQKPYQEIRVNDLLSNKSASTSEYADPIYHIAYADHAHLAIKSIKGAFREPYVRYARRR
jgi:hypothetical protein